MHLIFIEVSALKSAAGNETQKDFHFKSGDKYSSLYKYKLMQSFFCKGKLRVHQSLLV